MSRRKLAALAELRGRLQPGTAFRNAAGGLSLILERRFEADGVVLRCRHVNPSGIRTAVSELHAAARNLVVELVPPNDFLALETAALAAKPAAPPTPQGPRILRHERAITALTEALRDVGLTDEQCDTILALLRGVPALLLAWVVGCASSLPLPELAPAQTPLEACAAAATANAWHESGLPGGPGICHLDTVTTITPPTAAAYYALCPPKSDACLQWGALRPVVAINPLAPVSIGHALVHELTHAWIYCTGVPTVSSSVGDYYDAAHRDTRMWKHLNPNSVERRAENAPCLLPASYSAH